MQISQSASGDIVMKGKGPTVTLGSTVSINDFTLPGAGEYDVATVQCEAVGLPTGLAYFLHLEDLHVTYLTRADSAVIKGDQAPTTDILVIDVRSEDSVEALKPLLKSIEPAYLFLIGSGATEDTYSALQLLTQQGVLKVTRASLPLEGTTLVTA